MPVRARSSRQPGPARPGRFPNLPPPAPLLTRRRGPRGAAPRPSAARMRQRSEERGGHRPPWRAEPRLGGSAPDRTRLPPPRPSPARPPPPNGLGRPVGPPLARSRRPGASDPAAQSSPARPTLPAPSAPRTPRPAAPRGTPGVVVRAAGLPCVGPAGCTRPLAPLSLRIPMGLGDGSQETGALRRGPGRTEGSEGQATHVEEH